MAAFLHSARLSEDRYMQALQARFGLIGYARWLKTLELVASAPRGEVPGLVAMPWADWLMALECDDDALGELLEFAERSGKVRRHADRFEFVGFGDLLPVEPEPVPFLFTAADQVSNWCAIELAMPGWLLERVETQRLFRRWVASNVTRDELEQAAQAAAKGAASLSPDAVHACLMEIRRARIEAARQ